MKVSLFSVRRRWRVLLYLGGAVALLTVAVLLVFQMRLPSDGTLWMDFASPWGDIEVALCPHSVVHGGDRVLAIEGVPVVTWMDRALRGEGADWRIGETLSYRLLRGGMETILSVRLRSLRWGQLLLLRWGIYVAAIVSLYAGFYVLLKFPQVPAARALYLAVVGLCIPLCLPMHVGLLTAPRLFFWQNVVKIGGRFLLAAGFLNVALVFPTPKPWWRRRKFLTPLLYLLPPLALLLGALLGADTPARRLILGWRLVLWLDLGMLLVAGGNIFHTYLTVTEDVARGQLRWMGWGMLFGGLPYLLLTGLPEMLIGHAWVNVGITATFIMIVPLAIAAAIARYRLFDIDTVVRQTLLFLVFALTVTVVYTLLNTILAFSAQVVAGEANELLVLFITAFFVGMVFWVYQQELSGFLARLFYRRQVAPQRLLSEMGERLSRAIHLKEIQRLLTEIIPTYLRAASGRLLLVDDQGQWLNAEGENGFSSLDDEDLEDFLETWRDQGGKPLRRALLPEWASASVDTFMQKEALELLFLLRSADQVVGLWGLGPTTPYLPYATEEVRVLQALAHQAAVAVENARLVHRLEERGDYLEAEVRRRMQMLEQERNRLNAILQNMVDGLLVTSPKGEVMLVNPAFEDLVRHSARRLVAQPVAQFMEDDDLEMAFQRALEQPGHAEIVELTLGERILRGAVVALRDHSAVITLLRDVTREVEVDRMKSELISSVSHELRTPLTSILGFTRLIQRAFENGISKVLPEDPQIQRLRERIIQNLHIMLVEGQRLTALIDDVLDVAALDAGRMEWHDQLYNFPALLRESVDHFRSLAQDKGLDLRLRIDHAVRQVEADPERIKQVLNNLLFNALKFTAEGGITVSACALKAGERVHGWTVPEGGAVLVSVADSGVGIPSEAQESIFQPFSRVAGAGGQQQRGTGLGLVICREIINHYGGAIWVESEVGKGSTFTFTLPLSRREGTSRSEELRAVQGAQEEDTVASEEDGS
ncbi:MAG: sensor histidine kinase [Anaerolineae bacterium]